MLSAIRKEKPLLSVETKTTGFSSPATDYAERRLDVGELVAPNPLTVFYFKAGKELISELFSPGDILVVDRAEDPKTDDICLGVNSKREFAVYKYGTHDLEHWGKITWIIRRANG